MTSRLLRSLWHDSGRKRKSKPRRIKASKLGRAKGNAVSVNSSLVNHTGMEFMELHGSTAVTASDDSAASPLAAVIVITSIFLFMTLSVTVAVLVFCRKKNTVFVLQKCEQEDEISYELDEINNTDIEFADFEGEHEAMQPKARKSATCPDLLDSIKCEDRQCLQLLLDATESETDDSGKERSPVHPKLKRRSKSFTFQGPSYQGYQQMVVTAVMETRNVSKSPNRGDNHNQYNNCQDNFSGMNLYEEGITLNENNHSLSFRSEINLYHGSDEGLWTDVYHDATEAGHCVMNSLPATQKTQNALQPIPDISSCFNNAKLAFLDTDLHAEREDTRNSTVLPENVCHGGPQTGTFCAELSNGTQMTIASQSRTAQSVVQSKSITKSTHQSSMPSSLDQSGPECHSPLTNEMQPSTSTSAHHIYNHSHQSNLSSQETNQSETILQTLVCPEQVASLSCTSQRTCEHTADDFSLTNLKSAQKLQENTLNQSESMSYMDQDSDRSGDLSPMTDETGLLG